MSLCAGNGQLSEACLHLGAGRDVVKRRKQERPEEGGPRTPAMLPSLHRRGIQIRDQLFQSWCTGREKETHTLPWLCVGLADFF